MGKHGCTVGVHGCAVGMASITSGEEGMAYMLGGDCFGGWGDCGLNRPVRTRTQSMVW